MRRCRPLPPRRAGHRRRGPAVRRRRPARTGRRDQASQSAHRSPRSPRWCTGQGEAQDPAWQWGWASSRARGPASPWARAPVWDPRPRAVRARRPPGAQPRRGRASGAPSQATSALRACHARGRWERMAAVNGLDWVIVALLLLSIVTGFRRGAALQLVTYTGLIAGLVVGALVAPRVAGLARDPFAQAAAALLTLLLMAAAGDAVGWLIGRRVWAAARRSRLDPLDSGAGSVIAGVAALLTVWFLAFNLVQGPFPILSRQIRGSAIVRTIDSMLPRPPSILAQVRGFFDRFGFPEVFAGLPPAPAGPVQEPSQAEARQAFDAADQSTGRVIYGESVVRRQVYELQTVVRPGNSGGPFVSTDGDVAGVVFAASTTDDGVGYALTAAEAEPQIDRARDRTGAVSTGPCIR